MNNLIKTGLVLTMLTTLSLAMDRAQQLPRDIDDYTINISEFVNETIINQIPQRSNIANDISFSFIFNEQEQLEAANNRAAIYFTKQVVNMYDDGVIGNLNGQDLIRDLPGNVENMLGSINHLGVKISDLEGELARKNLKKITVKTVFTQTDFEESIEESSQTCKLTLKLEDAYEEIKHQKNLNLILQQEFEIKLAQALKGSAVVTSPVHMKEF